MTRGQGWNNEAWNFFKMLASIEEEEANVEEEDHHAGVAATTWAELVNSLADQ